MKVRSILAVAAAAAAMFSTAAPALASPPPPGVDMGCSSGDVCFYSSTDPSKYNKIGIGRGEDYDWSVSSSPYKNVKAIYNHGVDDGWGDVVVTLVRDGRTYYPCINTNNWITSYGSTVIGIHWKRSSTC